MMQKIPPQLRTFVTGIDRGLIAALILCLFALYPLLRAGLPNGTDVLYHVYRVAEMDRAWSHGVLMPRWAEAFYFGYGSPVFHYYASFTYYVTSVLMRLFALDALNALRALIVVCVLLGGAGMYLFARDVWRSQLAGIIAALCYVYAPYMIFTEPYARGAYPEYLALSLFPLVMWRFQRLLITGRAWDVVFAALGVGVLVITHNLTALSGFGVVLAWIAWHLLTRAVSWQRVRLAGLAAVLGVGVAAYFWLPVILERGEVKLENLIAVSQLDFRNFFVPLSHLFAFTPRPDDGAINGLLHQLNIGVAQWALALTGIIGIAILYLTKRTTVGAQRAATSHPNTLIRYLLFFALASLALIFIISPLSTWLWDNLSALAYFQFPWRFLGPLAFTLAALAGVNALWIERLPARLPTLMSVVAVLLPLALALPTLYVPEWVHPTVDTSVAAYQQAEVAGLQLGTTFSNEYLPRQVFVLREPTPRLLADYADGYPVNRANLEALPPGASVELIEHSPQSDTWQVSAAADFTMEVLTFYFPGWMVYIDDEEVPITPSDQHGMITFPVPAGTHNVRLFLGSTPARGIGGWLTLFSAVALVATIWRQKRGTIVSTESIGTLPHYNERNQALWYGVGLGGLLMIMAVLTQLRAGGAWVQSPPGEALVAQHQIDFRLGDDTHLIGYDLNATSFRPGDRVELVLYWYAEQPAPYKYQPFVHIGVLGVPPLAQAPGKDHPGGRPMTEWSADGYIRDEHVIFLPPDMPAGEYQIIIGLYTCETRPAGECGNGERPAVYDAAGEAIGDVAPIATITVGN